MKLLVSLLLFFILIEIFFNLIKNKMMLADYKYSLIFTVVFFFNLYYCCNINYNSITIIIIIIYYYDTIMSLFLRMIFIKIYFCYLEKFFYGEPKLYLYVIKKNFGSVIFTILFDKKIRYIIYTISLYFFGFEFYIILWLFFEWLSFFSLSVSHIGNILVLAKNKFNQRINLTSKGKEKKKKYLETLIDKKRVLDPFKFKIKHKSDFVYEDSYLNELTEKGFN